METLIIDRKKWLRGTGGGVLRTLRGQMCCLGFDLRRRGFKAKNITGLGMPWSVSTAAQVPIDGLTVPLGKGYTDTVECSELADLNDRQDLLERDREKHIKMRFMKIGVRVKFIN